MRVTSGLAMWPKGVIPYSILAVLLVLLNLVAKVLPNNNFLRRDGERKGAADWD